MSYQCSWCQLEQSKCSNQMFEVSPFRAYTFIQSIMPLIHWSVNNVLIKTAPLFNQSFFQIVDVTDLAAVLVPAECPKSHSPPDWDLDFSVANPVGWWSRASQLTVVQPSHGHSGLWYCPAGTGRWRSQRLNEWLAVSVTEICDSSVKELKIS